MGVEDTISRLESWHLGHCDGDWEHGSGMSIETLDNPGWRVRINLVGTPLDAAAFERVEIHRTEHDWLVCWIEGGEFNAACGPRNLAEALTTFLDWARP